VTGPARGNRRAAKKAPPKKAPKKRPTGKASSRGKRGKSGKKKGWFRRQPGLKGLVLWLVRLGVVAGAVVFVLGVAATWFAYQRTTIPDPNEAFQTQTTYIYYAGGKTKVGQFADQNRESISYDEMPECIKSAVVAAEDRSFWTNKGIDPKGILRAAFSNAQAGEVTAGGSTITQQYVKILYLNQERTYTRKIKEAFLSLKIQRTKSKQQILEGYLNTIYFGRGAYGIQAASRAWFNKPASKLDVSQCAVLASIINNPYRLDPDNGEASADALKRRYRWVLTGMADAGDITDAEAQEAMVDLPKFPKQKSQSTNGGQKGHMLKLVSDELHRLGFSDSDIQGGGLRVTTTFTQDAMNAAEQAVKEEAPTEARDGSPITDDELHVGVATVQVGTGALVGFYGGQDFLKSQINWASAGGMAGSTMKPFTLAAALEAGFSLKDTFDGNSPYKFEGSTLTVHNEGENSGQVNGHSYGSAINATYALEQSVNTAFVDMSESIPDGPKMIYKTALAMGLTPGDKANKRYPGIPGTTTDLLPDDRLITLGKAQVSPINMANAYATIANRGQRSDVHVVTKVEDRYGNVKYQWKNKTDDAIEEPIADDVSYAMQQVVQRGTGRAALALGRPAGGKTGTATNDDGDVSSAWFVGFTPQYSTAVMYVRGKGREKLDGWMPSYFGADYPTDTWLKVMERDLEGTEVVKFPPPANVDGDAPTSGHNPTPPPAPPATTKSEKPKKTKKPIVIEPTSEAPPPVVETTSAPPPPPPTTSAAPPPATTSQDPCLLGLCTPTTSPGGGSSSPGGGGPSQGGSSSAGP